MQTSGHKTLISQLGQPSTDRRTAAPKSTTKTTHIWQEDPLTSQDGTTYGARLELPDGTTQRVWYKVPSAYSSLITDSCDSFLTGALLKVANYPARVHVHGKVSPSLLSNLVEFQSAFQMWYSNSHQFSPVEITADQEVEDDKTTNEEKALCCFSGGIDSAFSVYHHTIDPERNRFSHNIQAGLFALGADIPLKEEISFGKLIVDYKQLLGSVGLDLITIRSNLRELSSDWSQSHGLAMAAQLMLFKRGFNTGIISSTDEYNQPITPWGSNPTTDHLLSSNSFKIVHDGCGFSRSQKVAAIANWKECYDQLRVCFAGPDYTRNCGRCAKCTAAWLCTQVVGVPTSKSLPAPTVDSILSIRGISQASLQRLVRVTKHPQWKRVPSEIRAAVNRFVRYQSRQHLLQQKFPGNNSDPGVLLSKIHKHIGIHFA